MTKFNKSQIFVLITSSLNAVLSLFINTFLVARILNISSNGLANISTFYLVTYSMLLVFYFLFSIPLKKFNKLHFYRGGIFLRLAYILFLTFMRDNLSQYLVLIAAINGLTESVYWSSYNSMKNEIVDKKHIKNFVSTESIMDQIVRIVAPVLLGSAIDFLSFDFVLILICFVSFGQFVCTFFISNNKMSKFAFSAKKFFGVLKQKKTTRSFLMLFLNFFLVGLREGMNALIVYIIVLTFQSNTSLGSISSIIGVLLIFTVFLFARFYKTEKHAKLIPLFGTLSAIGVCVLFFGFSKITIILFHIIYSVNFIVPNTLNNINRNYLTQKYKLQEYIVENNAFAELFLNIGRVVCFLLLFLVGLSNSLTYLYVMLGFEALVLVLYGVFVWLLENKNRVTKDEE